MHKRGENPQQTLEVRGEMFMFMHGNNRGKTGMNFTRLLSMDMFDLRPYRRLNVILDEQTNDILK